MIRDTLKDNGWLSDWIVYEERMIRRFLDEASKPAKNPSYQPQFMYEISSKYLSLALRKYSRGDSIDELQQYFPPLLAAWEEAERLGKDVWTEQQQYTRHAWKVNLDHYIVCFWLVGLALALNVPEDQWQRLVTLVDNEGEDALLDRVIATRQPGRRIGAVLCHPKPYQRLLDAVLATPEKQPKLLLTFVDKWYSELNRSPRKGLSDDTAVYERPYWYKSHELEGGYFGYWCIEAVAAVKAFGLDDSLCLGHPNYPGDLLRPDGATTHPRPPAQEDIPSPSVASRGEDVLEPPVGLFTRWFGRHKPRK